MLTRPWFCRFPLPDWIYFSDPGAVIAQSNYRQESNQNQFSIEQIPLIEQILLDENFETYTNLVRLSATQGGDVSLEDVLSNMFAAEKAQCATARIQPFASSPQPDMVLFTLVCGEQANSNSGAFVTHGRLDHDKGLTIIEARQWWEEPFERGGMTGASRPPVEDSAFSALTDRLLNEMDVIAP